MTSAIRSARRPSASTAHRSRVLMAAACAALVVGCGGGGGGSSGPSVEGNGFAANSGPGDTAQHFPAAIGDRWVYDRSASEAGLALPDSLYASEVTATRSLLGVTAHVLTQTDPTAPGAAIETYVNLRPGGVTHLGNNDPADTLSPQIVPYVELAFPVAQGPVSTVTAKRLPAGTDGAGNELTLDLTQRVVNVAVESVDVPAGRFAQALRQTTTIDAVVHSATQGVDVPVRAVQTRWYAPGVGIVKQSLSTTVEGSTSSSSGELRGYTVGGAQRGLGEPFEVASALSPDNGDPNPPVGAPAVATDGQNFLVVSRRASGAGAPYQTQWIATLVALDGSVLATDELTAPETAHEPQSTRQAAVVFDGTGFTAVVPRDNDFATSGQAPSLLTVRVSAAGARLAEGQVVAADGAFAPALAFDGTRLLLVFKRGGTAGGAGSIRGVFVSASTGAADGAEFAVTGAAVEATSPTLAFGGGQFLAAWNQVPATQPGGVFAARISTAGGVLDAVGIAVRSTTACCVDHLPGVRHDGTQFVLAWRDFRGQQDSLHTNLRAARMSAAGQVLDGPPDSAGIALSSAADQIDGAALLTQEPGGDTLVAWLSLPPTQSRPELRGARMAGDGAIIVSSPQGTPLWRQGAPSHAAIAAHAGGALAVWLESNAPVAPNCVRAMAIRRFGS